MACNTYVAMVQGLDIYNTKQQSPKCVLNQKNQQGLSSAGDVAQQDMETLSNSEDHQPHILNYNSASLAKPAEKL